MSSRAPSGQKTPRPRVARPQPDRPASGRPNVAEIDLAALAGNVGVVRKLVGAQTRLYAAVKADAYGFGLERMATEAVAAGVDALAMADPTDALRVRRQGLTVPILLYPGALLERALLDQAARHELTLTITDAEAARVASQLARRPVEVFLKVDVGMERLGCAPGEIAALAELVRALPRITLMGVYTHMHVGSAPDPHAYFHWQIDRFQGVLDDLRQREIEVPLAMAASSPALVLLRQPLFDAVDPGHLIYGMAPPVAEKIAGLRPVLRSLRTRIIQEKAIERSGFADEAPFDLRPGMRIAVLPIGRADGLQFLTTGEVLLRGRRCPIVGKLSLEHVRIDVTDVPKARVGDEVVIIGEQGDETLTLEQVRQRTGLDEVGITIAIGRSIPREYLERGER
jgi:alanine racemase